LANSGIRFQDENAILEASLQNLRLMRNQKKQALLYPGILAATALVLHGIPSLASAKSADTKPTVVPIRAELLASIDTKHAKTGDPLLAKVLFDWSTADCALRKGAIIEGRVATVLTKSGASLPLQMTLTFDQAACNGGDLNSFPLTLAAVVGPRSEADEQYYGSSTAMRGMLNALNGSANSAHVATMGGGRGSDPSAPIKASEVSTDLNELSGPQMQASKVDMGDVVNLNGVKLDVGGGDSHDSVLETKKKNIALARHTILVLVPAKMVFRDSPIASAASANAATTAKPVSESASSREAAPIPLIPKEPEPVDDIALCEPPACHPVSSESSAASVATAGFSLAQVGYHPRPNAEIDSLRNDITLAYLGPHRLLVAFNPHTLVPRYASNSETAPVRVIRAALFELPGMKVVRTIDWPIADFNSYLWMISGNRVLVHAGSELRVYDANLHVEQRIPVDGKLQFVRVSPSQKYVVVGVMHERHTQRLHTMLVEQMGRDPEEDVEIQVLDSTWKQLATGNQSSSYLPPVLSEEGEVSIIPGRNDQWQLSLHTWQQETRNLARIVSSCTPELTSFPPDLLFLVTCERGYPKKDYRVLRGDGKLLLKGISPSDEVGQRAIGTLDSGLFAVRLTEADHSINREGSFHGTDLKSDLVSVYRATDGRRIFATRIDMPASSNDSYALSPDGNQLAVLSGQQVAFYSLRR
jgi:hypothetical protein